MLWRSQCAASAPRSTTPTPSSSCTPSEERAMSLSFALNALDPRRWSLTGRMTLFFSVAIAAILFGVSGMMYKELVHQLHEKEEKELMNYLRIQQDILSDLERKK